MIPEEKVREVAERISITDVVGEYVQLRRAGANFLGLCPFHGEKTPSFNVNPAREMFHCFGCGAGGSVFTFIMRIEGVSFPEAVKVLARRAGVEIEERQLTPSERQAQDEREQFRRINEITAEFYRGTLEQKPEGASGRAYLDRRGVDGETAAAYRMGFAPDQRDALVNHLKRSGASLEAALKLGIVRKGDHGWHDLFRNRLIFPIRDSRGQVIAFAGRVLDASLPKYINSPESPLYHKSAVLFGLDMALPTVRTENALIIVEGYFDHLALYRAGVRNVAATCGTALTATHAGLIRRHASKVYTLFDSDAAGQKATVRSMELFLEQRIPAYVIALPAGDDPDSYLAANPAESFLECRDRARPAFEFFVRSLLTRHPPGTIDSKVRVIDEVIPRFRKIADPIERDLYEKEICRLLDITVHSFRKRMAGMALSPDTAHGQPVGTPPQKGDTTQETLLQLMSVYPEARDEVASHGPESLFSGEYLTLARLLLTVPHEDGQALGCLAVTADDGVSGSLLSRLLVGDTGHLADIDWRKAFEQCRRTMERRALPSMKEIVARLAVTDPGSEEHTALLKQAEELRAQKSKL